MRRLKLQRAMLVYQAGIANVFQVHSYNLANDNRKAKRLLQGAFSECIRFAQGLVAAGVGIKTAGCNMTGDIVEQKWTDDLESLPFSDKFTIIDANNTGV